MNVQIWELILAAIPIGSGIITHFYRHGQRLGRIEAKLDLLFDDVRALEKYN
jgi:hypothetical protein